MRTTSLSLVFSCLMFLPAASEPASTEKEKKAKPALEHSIQRNGGVTEIKIHDNRIRKAKPAAAPVAPSSPAPSLTSAAAPSFQEVEVRAPRLEAVPQAPRKVTTSSTVWSQDHEPGPASQAAANVGGTTGISILSTQPYYYPGYSGAYSPGYFSAGYYGPGFSAGYYGPGYSAGYYGPGAYSRYRGGCGATGYVGPAGTFNATYSLQAYQFPASVFAPTPYPYHMGGGCRPWYR